MKVCFLFIIVSVATSCSILSDIKYTNMLGDAELFDYDYGEINNHEDIAKWIDSYIVYDHIADPQSPEQTIKKGTGGCLAKAILYMNIAYYELDIEMSIIMVSSRNVIGGGIVDHSEVYFEGNCYSVDSGSIKQMDIGYIYSFDEVFK